MVAGAISAGRRAARASAAALWSWRKQWLLLHIQFLPPMLAVAGRALELGSALPAAALRAELVCGAGPVLLPA